MASVDAATAMQETVWLNANSFYDAERRWYESPPSPPPGLEYPRRSNPGHHNPGVKKQPGAGPGASLASEIAYARQKIQNFLKSGDSGMSDFSKPPTVLNRLEKIEKEQARMKQQLDNLAEDFGNALHKLSQIEFFLKVQSNQASDTVLAPKKCEPKGNMQNGSTPAADDDDLDLFGSDEEDADAAKLREERLQAYANKKAKKPALVAKSSVVLDVKPWDDETDMKAMETAVKGIQCDGLVWGASKLVPLAYGIKKLQIVAIVEDEKVSVDWLQETIGEIEDLVQSVDIAAFNKL